MGRTTCAQGARTGTWDSTEVAMRASSTRRFARLLVVGICFAVVQGYVDGVVPEALWSG